MHTVLFNQRQTDRFQVEKAVQRTRDAGRVAGLLGAERAALVEPAAQPPQLLAPLGADRRIEIARARARRVEQRAAMPSEYAAMSAAPRDRSLERRRQRSVDRQKWQQRDIRQLRIAEP